MGINSRVGLYYGVLIDQYWYPKKIEGSKILKDLDKQFNLSERGWDLDTDMMSDQSDFMVIYDTNACMSYGDHSNKGNYGFTFQKLPEVSAESRKLATEIADYLRISAPKEVNISVGFNVVSFMD